MKFGRMVDLDGELGELWPLGLAPKVKKWKQIGSTYFVDSLRD